MMRRDNMPMLLAALLLSGVPGFGQDSGAARQTAGPISIDISVSDSPVSGNKTSINEKFINNSDEYLVLSFDTDTAPYSLHIKDINGVVPPETPYGCHRHKSTTCEIPFQEKGDGKMMSLYVLPHNSTTIQIDVGKEYVLNFGTYQVELNEDNLVAIAAPPDKGAFGLGGYPRRKLGPIFSNRLILRVP
jgi:hypothetical protein